MSDAAEPPLFAGTILGLRAWVVEDVEPTALSAGVALGAVFTDGVWEQTGRWTQATCSPMASSWEYGSDRHEAPGPGCSCGLYAWHPQLQNAEMLWIEHVKAGTSLDPCHPELNGVAGVIEACGRIEVHEDGFRAERARVSALLVGRDWAPEAIARVEQIAGLYRARVLSLDGTDELVAYCREQGSALPPERVHELLGVPPPPAPQPRTLLDAVGDGLRKLGVGIAAVFVFAFGAAFYGSIAFAVVAFVGSILFGWFETDPKPPPAASVTKVRIDRNNCSVWAQVSARKPVEELTLRATGRDAEGIGFGHATESFGRIETGTTWMRAGRLKRKFCDSPAPFSIRVRAVWPGRLGAIATVRSVAETRQEAPGTHD